MRHHFFLHYGCFFQNLGKEAVPTFMHTTVAEQLVRRGNVCIMYTVCRNAIMAKTDYEKPEKNKIRVQVRPL